MSYSSMSAPQPVCLLIGFLFSSMSLYRQVIVQLSVQPQSTVITNIGSLGDSVSQQIHCHSLSIITAIPLRLGTLGNLSTFPPLAPSIFSRLHPPGMHRCTAEQSVLIIYM
ncbi:uncharacterized protein YALI1_D02655g [Yarrowia lipolytica]|uniref:Uncharacterized protein n=1 Tax=Yarrowia lipolytica TaxID=4952 RepID=A0A1D8NCV4_YARLL|nr:hypothetical protein YALI1_D02655g [Yarrowia lipolytica]